MWVRFFLLVLSLAPRGFSPGTPFFCLLKTLPNSNSIWNARRHFNEFLRIPKCFMGKQIDLVTVVEPILTSEITVFESNFLSKIVRSEALVYNSYFFQNSCFTEIIRH